MMIQQYRSLIRVSQKQRRIVKSLGLRRIGHVRDVKNNDAIQGMVRKVPHLVKVLSGETSL